jgi:hypothetical protein
MSEGGLFHIDDTGRLVAMRATPYSAEDVLQKLLATYPDLHRAAGVMTDGLAALASVVWTRTSTPSSRVNSDCLSRTSELIRRRSERCCTVTFVSSGCPARYGTAGRSCTP